MSGGSPAWLTSFDLAGVLSSLGLTSVALAFDLAFWLMTLFGNGPFLASDGFIPPEEVVCVIATALDELEDCLVVEGGAAVVGRNLTCSMQHHFEAPLS